MLYLSVCLLIFLVLVVLVCVYHLYCWDSGLGVSGSRAWVSSFECGFLGGVLVENVFSYTYFVLLVFFVVFDLEISLLINIPFQGYLMDNFFFFFFFVFVLVVGYYFEVKKGFVSWNY